jgi:signal transduction histidine kinase
MNPAGLAMIEADSSDQVIGKSVLPLIVSEHRQSFQTFIETISRGESNILQFQVVGLKGTRRWLESHAVPMRDSDGQIIASLSITRDVTEHKRLEKEILEISEKEQRRLGQDLHDGLGQHLAGLACLMKGLEQKLAVHSEPEQKDAALLTSLVNEAIAQTRSLARGLYPVELEANGLMAALEELACNTAKIFNFSCRFQCDEPVLVHDNSAATHLYRIAQGAVDNAIKHSKAKQLLICLAKANGKMVLSVSDDGVGIEDLSELNKGMGLRIMRHRAEMIKGVLDIRRGHAGGTVVTCSL